MKQLPIEEASHDQFVFSLFWHGSFLELSVFESSCVRSGLRIQLGVGPESGRVRPPMEMAPWIPSSVRSPPEWSDAGSGVSCPTLPLADRSGWFEALDCAPCRIQSSSRTATGKSNFLPRPPGCITGMVPSLTRRRSVLIDNPVASCNCLIVSVCRYRDSVMSRSVILAASRCKQCPADRPQRTRFADHTMRHDLRKGMKRKRLETL